MTSKIDKTVKRETIYIAIWIVLLSILMEAVFLIIGKWNLYVLFGNLWGAFLGVMNFLIMGIGVQKALDKKDEKEAQKIIKISHSLRFLGLILFTVLGAVFLNVWTVVIPLIFPRIALIFRPKFGRDE